MDHGGPFSTPVVNVMRTNFALTGSNGTVVAGPVLVPSATCFQNFPSIEISTRNPRGKPGPVGVFIGAPPAATAAPRSPAGGDWNWSSVMVSGFCSSTWNHMPDACGTPLLH